MLMFLWGDNDCYNHLCLTYISNFGQQNSAPQKNKNILYICADFSEFLTGKFNIHLNFYLVHTD